MELAVLVNQQAAKADQAAVHIPAVQVEHTAAVVAVLLLAIQMLNGAVLALFVLCGPVVPARSQQLVLDHHNF
jgi:hypothetical protein